MASTPLEFDSIFELMTDWQQEIESTTNVIRPSEGQIKVNLSMEEVVFEAGFDTTDYIIKYMASDNTLMVDNGIKVPKDTLKAVNNFTFSVDLCEDYKKPYINTTIRPNPVPTTRVYTLTGINPATLKYESWLTPNKNSKRPPWASVDYVQITIFTE